MPLKARLISDFNLEILTRLLNSNNEVSVEAEAAPFGQVLPALLSDDLVEMDVGFVWTQPEGTLESFQRLLNFEKVSPSEVLDEAMNYAQAILKFKSSCRHLFVVNWTLDYFRKGYGVLDWKLENGFSRLIAQMNLTISEILNKDGIYFISSDSWFKKVGRESHNSKMWHMSRVPYSNSLFVEAKEAIIEAIKSVQGHVRKWIILDLDDTLWGGAVGEEGLNGLKLGGHDLEGGSYVAFQNSLKSLSNRGIQLAVVSKNDEKMALEAIEKHPEMILKKEDFLGWRINWQDKAQNLIELSNEVRLSLDHAVFIDNSPHERSRIQEAFPEVLVPDWPPHPADYERALLELGCFQSAQLTEEDAERTRMYQEEKEREAGKSKFQSVDEWLAQLDIHVTVQNLCETDQQRVVQLLNKTNQMNLSTRRLSSAEFSHWLEGGERDVWTIRVKDKFGDSGLVGILSTEKKDEALHLVDFILSCRVIGRKVEETMLYVFTSLISELKCRQALIEYVETEKNSPCLEFLKRSELQQGEISGHFIWGKKEASSLPSCVQLNWVKL